MGKLVVRKDSEKDYKPQSASGRDDETTAWKKRGSFVNDADLGSLSAVATEFWRTVGQHRSQQLVAKQERGEWFAVRQQPFIDRDFWSDYF